MVDPHEVEMIFGWSLAVGDYDGDGYDDIAAGSPGEQSNNCYGEVMVVFGDSGGVNASSMTAEIFDVGVFLGLSGDTHDFFGLSLASADYDGDGFDDLAIGAPGREVSDINYAGMVFVSFGSSTGFMDGLHSTALRPQFFDQAQAFSVTIEWADYFGACLTSGDLNGDGIGDLVISSPYKDIGSTPDAGVLGVLFGSPLELAGGTPSEAGWQETWFVGNSHKYDRFGEVLACGDANGDGSDDLVVGVAHKDLELKDDAGQVCVIYGSNALGDVLNTAALPLVLPAVDASSVEWGDFSDDGNLDFLLTGWTGTEAISRLYQNDGAGSFVEVPSNLEGVFDGSSAWADYDNDGDLDLLMTGYTTPLGDAKPVSRLYRNDGDQTFTSQDHLALPRVGESEVVWLDYNDDGKVDFLLTGRANGVPIAVLYRNDFYFDYSGELVARFIDAGFGLEGVCHGAASWHEGWLAVTGLSASGPSSRLYQFSAGALVLNKSLSPGTFRGTATFTPPLEPGAGGMWNLVLTGATHAPGWPVARVLEPNSLEGYKFPPLGVYRSAADWGDFDNDGDFDLLFTGKKYDGSREAFVSVNSFDEDARFHNRPLDLPAVDNGDIAWADWDNDGLFEILISGSTESGRTTGLYELTGAIPVNSVPQVPGGLVSSVGEGNVTLEWMPALDSETPQFGLSYALRVGSTPGGCEILAPAAQAFTGKRKLVKPGNVGFRTSKTIVVPPGVETIYWSVQAVDGACAGSPFSAEKTVSLNVSDPEGTVLPVARALHQNSPNPFNPSTTIYFDLVASERVDLVVYDARGRFVKSLLSGASLPVGRHEAIWSGRDSHGRTAAAGVYFYVLTSDNFRETRRMALVK